MKAVVVGAGGLIGKAICARLLAEGHEVVVAGREQKAPLLPEGANWIRIDLASPDPAAWAAALSGADVLINCAGTLQDSARDSVSATHQTGAEALFDACVEAGVKRVVHFSAIGVDRHQVTAFSSTKLAGDRALMDKKLDWIILRPSVVLGRGVFGASALFRGLSALPFLPVMPGTGDLQVVALDDVVETVVRLVDPQAPSGQVIELAGPQALSMEDVVATYRRWHGWRPARRYQVPEALANLLYRLGDFVGLLGWRPPIRSTARREMQFGAVGSSESWRQVTGIEPRSLEATLQAEPVTVQDRWFAKLYFLKPILFVVLSSFWLLTGIISLTTGFPIGVDLMVQARTGVLAAPGVIAGAIADIIIGLAIAFRPTAWYGLWGAIGLSCFYIIAGTLLLPELWNEPLGPLLKIWPILVAHFVALAVLDER